MFNLLDEFLQPKRAKAEHSNWDFWHRRAGRASSLRLGATVDLDEIAAYYL